MTDNFRDTVIDYQGFSRSFRYFHPDIDLVVFGDAVINKLFAEKPWLNHFNCKASFARLLYDDYDLVINVDSDFYFFDRCVEMLEGDFELAACANFNAYANVNIMPRLVDGVMLPHVSDLQYIQGGLIASTSKKFWDDYEALCYRIAMKLPLYENDVLNVLWYSGKYDTKVLDGDLDYRSPKFTQFYNCASLNQERNAVIENDRVFLNGKPMRSYHVAHGNRGPGGAWKARIPEIFSPQVTTWFDNKIMGGTDASN